MTSTSASVRHGRSTKLLLGAGLPAVGLVAFVQITGWGIDLLLLAAAVLLLLGLERSVGDWVAEWFGPFAAAALLGVLVIASSWYFLSNTLGRSKTDRFFMEAERRGYRTVYYQTPTSATSDEETPPAAASVAAGPATPPAASGRGTAGTKGQERLRSDAGVATASNDARDAAPLESVDKQPPPTDPPASSASTGVSGWVGSLLRRDSSARAAIPTTIAISLSPSKVEQARRTTITAVVAAGSGPVTRGTVEFMVNGLGAGRMAVNGHGTASTVFVPQMSGTYEVRARFVGTSEHAACFSTSTLEVVAKR